MEGELPTPIQQIQCLLGLLQQRWVGTNQHAAQAPGAHVTRLKVHWPRTRPGWTGRPTSSRMWNKRFPKVPARSVDEFRSTSAIVAWVLRHVGGWEH